ncbi:MAG TPA: hypothetical protein DDW50_10570 [Firmicutes bacterium]|jgi:hypothetical protein|nr:hypothetical protein [Bacillota bacterium]
MEILENNELIIARREVNFDSIRLSRKMPEITEVNRNIQIVFHPFFAVTYTRARMGKYRQGGCFRQDSNERICAKGIFKLAVFKNGYSNFMAYILATAAFWVLFLLLVPGFERPRYYPTLLFSALLALVADLCGVVFDQWAYYGPVVGTISLWSDLGIAPAESGLFIYFFPGSANWFIKICYFIVWSVSNAAGEWFFVWVGWIGYDHWNPIRATIFYIFYWSAVWAQEYWYNATGRLKGR